MTIIYTLTDEAPLLATRSLLPIIQAFARQAGVSVETRDISLAARIIAQFPDHLPAEQRLPDDLAELGRLAKTPSANIVKLPNISASTPQLKAAIAELRGHGVLVPEYPEAPATDEEADIRARYDKVLGSAVNPVLREGNSDRRAPESVKSYARAHPHKMGAWSPDSLTEVATMADGDFRHSEQTFVSDAGDELTIQWVGADGETRVLASGLRVSPGEVVDAARMRAAALDAFLAEQVRVAKQRGVLFSLHLKATMMKVSDPIIFGHAIKAFFPRLFARHGDALAAAGLRPDDGLGAILSGLDRLDPATKAAAREAIDDDFADGPALAMVDSARGVTNLHVPSDVIVDASMPAMIRAGGRMWGPDGREADTLAVIPDSCYAGVYQAVVEDCRANGAFDPTTMGTVPNVGLMAGRAEEYGSHATTFLIDAPGELEVVSASGVTLMSHAVAVGDIWRACRTRDDAIRDWVRLAVSRARATGWPAVFWLDPERSHDRALAARARELLAEHDTSGLEILTMGPVEATRYTLARLRRGENTISVTGNVLRDYLTDLFPILELGTSAKMLSIVPLMAGGGLYETGAGGSAPKHVQQLLHENYLRWDSLGEFLALAPSLEQEASSAPQAATLARALDRATGRLLAENQSPSRRLGGIDNRGSHFHLARHWAVELAGQDEDPALAARFADVAEALTARAEVISAELLAVQGAPADIGGYYRPDLEKATAVMRPSETLNAIIGRLG